MDKVKRFFDLCKQIETLQNEAASLLIEVQQEQWPGSTIFDATEALGRWSQGTDNEVSRRRRIMALALQYPVCVFYETQPSEANGGKPWKGIRVGMEPGDYISNLD